MITVITLKRVIESIFLQSNKFTACKVRDGNEEAKSLMVFNLHKYNVNKGFSVNTHVNVLVTLLYFT